MIKRQALEAVRARTRDTGPAVRFGRLSLEERTRIIDTFANLIEGLYAHLPQKKATYGHDPSLRLRSLRVRVDKIDERAFHRTMAEIINDLHDAHTRYLGPEQTHGRVAVLPVLLERYADGDQDRYIVSKVFHADKELVNEMKAAGFEPGVEVTHWNGVPIMRAVELHGETETGGRSDARRARALESLTLRPLRYALLPNEEWVEVTFLGNVEGTRSVRLDWTIIEEDDLPRIIGRGGVMELSFAGDPASEAARRIKKMLFATNHWYESLPEVRGKRLGRPKRRKTDWRHGRFEDAVSARHVETPSGVFGHLRLWTFDVRDDDGFLAEVMELVRDLPKEGLIIDLRGNPGGLVWAAERLLQLFTPGEVSPTGFSMLATDVTRMMVNAPQNRTSLAPWRRSLENAVVSGELYSREVPLTPPERCNDIGQRYPGPAVLVVDASTYSSGDLFAAGFVDNRIGTVVSVDEATGAGGANVWYADQFVRALNGTPAELAALPRGITYTMAIRRAVRVGRSAGRGIEDLGIAGHFRHALTRDDLVSDNKDLLGFCGQLLASEALTDLSVQLVDDSIRIRTRNLDRVDMYIDGKAREDRRYRGPIRQRGDGEGVGSAMVRD